MAQDKETMVALLNAFTECIEGASVSEFRALVSGNASLRISKCKADDQPMQKSASPVAEFSDVALNQLTARLHSLESREEGVACLESAQLRRVDLERLARALDLPVRKTDKIERMRDMIVDATIGSRLNSKAIRGS
jgi:hypothetical protein